MLLGKPGSGKTTFLQHIAMQCNQGELLPERIPIFIRLKNFANASEVGRFAKLYPPRASVAAFQISKSKLCSIMARL